MNPTIEKIVNLLFEELEENEETRALREEILNNCQERYNDLLERGMSEDEAIHAVVESLNGMEEMLKSYPRKAREDEEESNEGSYRFEADTVREIALRLANEDVEVLPSEDEWVHVDTEGRASRLSVSLENGTLSVSRVPNASHGRGLEFTLNLNDIFSFNLSDLSKSLGNLAHGSFSFRDKADVRIRLPEGCRPAACLGTASGDIEMEAVVLSSLDAATTSGDLRLDDVCADEVLKLSSASGDVEWNGKCVTLDAGTLSGDLNLDGYFVEGHAKATSGDIDLTVRGSSLRTLTAQSTSGDLDIRLPEVSEAQIECHTVSGDVRQRISSASGSAVTVRLSSVSGDVSVKR